MTSLNKRHFLIGSASAIVAAPSLAADAGWRLGGVAPRLDAASGVTTWQAFLGERFELGGQMLTLSAVDRHDPSGAQFSLSFAATDVGVATPGAGLQTMSHSSGAQVTLYVDSTPTGLRADFARLTV